MNWFLHKYDVRPVILQPEMKIFARPCYRAGQQVVQIQTMENAHQPQFPVILMPWFPCLVLGGKGS